jgi:hypothetical protein
LQRYKCLICKHQFQSDKRVQQKVQNLWQRYIWGKQTIKQLAKQEKRSIDWVRTRLEKVEKKESEVKPQETVVVADTTFWGRSYGVTVFRSPTLKRNLWWSEVVTEKVATYHYGRKILEERGWTIKGAVVDAKSGLTSVFKNIPVQICQFHQMKTVTKYLSRRPKTTPAQELRWIMLTLTRTDEKTFTKLLDDWHIKYKNLIKEKEYDHHFKRRRYKNKEIRGAYTSMKRNLPYLFTYQKYPKLNIPNTTNSLEGFFTQLKSKVSIHRGSRQDRRYKIIGEILNGES